jgi:hypothetical protein
MMENLFCKIFVLSATERDAITEHVANHLGGRRDGNSVVCHWGVIDVLRNDDADCTRATGADGFLHFPYLIETEPEEGIDRDEFVRLIGSLLESLWSSRYGAVAACDFEGELPRNGGYVPCSLPEPPLE